MHRTINVSIRDKIAVAEKDALYICGNSDFVIAFDFDDEWAGYEYKTARFVFNDTYADVVFSGNECAVPVISNTYNFIVGVFAGDLHTTTPAYVAAKKSILCGSGMPVEPFETAYAQLIEIFNQSMATVNNASKEACSARDDAKASAESAAKSKADVEEHRNQVLDWYSRTQGYVVQTQNNAEAAKASAEVAAKSAEEAANHKHDEYAASDHKHDEYAQKESPVFTGSISLGRMEGTDVGDKSVAVGMDVTASGDYSHAEGSSCQATGGYSHAEGCGTMADGDSSHAEGSYTYAFGENSHTEGENTWAGSKNQHVQGSYNVSDDEGKYAHIVGNGYREGSKVHNSNAHTLDWEGNAWFAGTVEGTAMILLSPSGKRFKITVSDNGTLSAAEVTE